MELAEEIVKQLAERRLELQLQLITAGMEGKDGKKFTITKVNVLALSRPDLSKQHRERTASGLMLTDFSPSGARYEDNDFYNDEITIRNQNAHDLSIPRESADYSDEVYAAYRRYLLKRMRKAHEQGYFLNDGDIPSINDFVLEQLAVENASQGKKGALRKITPILATAGIQKAGGVWADFSGWVSRKYQGGKEWVATKLSPKEKEHLVTKAFKLRRELDQEAARRGTTVAQLKKELAEAGYPLPSTSTRQYLKDWYSGDARPTMEEFETYPDSISDRLYQDIFNRSPSKGEAVAPASVSVEEVLEDAEEIEERADEPVSSPQPVSRIIVEEREPRRLTRRAKTRQLSELTPSEPLTALFEKERSDNDTILELGVVKVGVEREPQSDSKDAKDAVSKLSQVLAKDRQQEASQDVLRRLGIIEKNLDNQEDDSNFQLFDMAHGAPNHFDSSAASISNLWKRTRRAVAGGSMDLTNAIAYAVGLVEDYYMATEAERQLKRSMWNVTQEQLVARLFDARFCRDIRMKALSTVDPSGALISLNVVGGDESPPQRVEVRRIKHSFEKAMVRHLELDVELAETLYIQKHRIRTSAGDVPGIEKQLMDQLQDDFAAYFPNSSELFSHHGRHIIGYIRAVFEDNDAAASHHFKELVLGGEDLVRYWERLGYNAGRARSLWNEHITCSGAVVQAIYKHPITATFSSDREYQNAKRKCILNGKSVGRFLDSRPGIRVNSIPLTSRATPTKADAKYFGHTRTGTSGKREGTMWTRSNHPRTEKAGAGILEQYGLGISSTYEKRPADDALFLVFDTYKTAFRNGTTRKHEEEFQAMVEHMSLTDREQFLTALRYLCKQREVDPYISRLERGGKPAEELMANLYERRSLSLRGSRAEPSTPMAAPLAANCPSCHTGHRRRKHRYAAAVAKGLASYKEMQPVHQQIQEAHARHGENRSTNPKHKGKSASSLLLKGRASVEITRSLVSKPSVSGAMAFVPNGNYIIFAPSDVELKRQLREKYGTTVNSAQAAAFLKERTVSVGSSPVVHQTLRAAGSVQTMSHDNVMHLKRGELMGGWSWDAVAKAAAHPEHNAMELRTAKDDKIYVLIVPMKYD